MPVPAQQPANSPATDHRPASSPPVSERMRQFAREVGHRRAIAEYPARHAADQQSRMSALLAEAIAALGDLLGQPPRHGHKSS